MRIVALVVAAGVVVGGCTAGPGAAPASADGAGDRSVALTVLAAASLKHAVERARTAYEVADPGTTITASTDSSAALRTQIEQGAPADVFLSADTSHPQALADAGLVEGRPVAFAGNQLTVIVPAGNPARIETPADLGRDGVEVVAAGAEVPVTRYAAEVIGNLAGLRGYPAGFAEAYEANVVSREDNVGAVVAKVALGEADAAIVYATDARASDRVTAVEIPDDANVRATYAGVVVRGSDEVDAARAFLDWLAGDEGRALLSSFGFLPP